MIRSNRNRFVGVHVTYSMRQFLGIEAKKLEVSVSRLVYEVLLRYLNENYPGKITPQRGGRDSVVPGADTQ